MPGIMVFLQGRYFDEGIPGKISSFHLADLLPQPRLPQPAARTRAVPQVGPRHVVFGVEGGQIASTM
jgi:hypothetical protein